MRGDDAMSKSNIDDDERQEAHERCDAEREKALDERLLIAQRALETRLALESARAKHQAAKRELDEAETEDRNARNAFEACFGATQERPSTNVQRSKLSILCADNESGVTLSFFGAARGYVKIGHDTGKDRVVWTRALVEAALVVLTGRAVDVELHDVSLESCTGGLIMGPDAVRCLP